uniref:C2H2-type domain-containing protein n=1 Tax=Kryptolebias marmoratus TaxID=37003 RepID=A0A3Q3EEW9_KRYMA
MSSVHHLREFIGEKLTAAAAEIFSEFEKTILRYEEELDRQRRLLDVRWNPEKKLLSVDTQQEPVHETEVILIDPQRSSSLDLEELEPEPPLSQGECEEPEPPRVKDDLEDQLHPKETGPFLVTASREESESEPESDGEQLVSQGSAGPEDQDPDSESSDHTAGRHGNQAGESTAERPFSCQFCGETFSKNSLLIRHFKVHKVRSPTSDRLQYCCPTCGKRFSACSHFIIHMRTHTGEKPFSCKFCGKLFTVSGGCNRHMRIHTGEKPFFCHTCGKSFNQASHLKRHMKLHPGRASAEEGFPE